MSNNNNGLGDSGTDDNAPDNAPEESPGDTTLTEGADKGRKITELDAGKQIARIGKYTATIGAVAGLEKQKLSRKSKDPDEKSQRVRKIIGDKNKDAILELYEGCPHERVTTAREKYIKYLAERQHKIKLPFIPVSTSMKELLGGEGIELYEAALQEEQNSREYREAVFLQSCTKYKGNPAVRDVMYIGGPSGSGKTNAVTNILAELQTEGEEEKVMVTIDGGIHRGMSAMRQLTNTFADMHNYNEITDLYEKGSNRDIRINSILKEVTEKAKLNTVIPETFVEAWWKSFLPSFIFGPIKDTIKGLINTPDNNVHFVKVEIDENVCKYMGKMRAASSLTDDERQDRYSNINSPDYEPDTPHESKSASTNVAKGIETTSWAENIFNAFNRKPNVKMYTYNSNLAVNKTKEGYQHLGTENEFKFLTKLMHAINSGKPTLTLNEPKFPQTIDALTTEYFQYNNIPVKDETIDAIVAKCEELKKQQEASPEVPCTLFQVANALTNKNHRILPYVPPKITKTVGGKPQLTTSQMQKHNIPKNAQNPVNIHTQTTGSPVPSSAPTGAQATIRRKYSACKPEERDGLDISDASPATTASPAKTERKQ